MAPTHSKFNAPTKLKGMMRYLYCNVPSHCNSNASPVVSIEDDSSKEGLTDLGGGLPANGLAEGGSLAVPNDTLPPMFPIPPWIGRKAVAPDSILVLDSLLVKMELGEGSRSPMGSPEGGLSSADELQILDLIEGKCNLDATKKRRQLYELNRHFQENWVAKLPWAEVVLVADGSMTMVKCTICSSVDSRDKLLVAKLDSLWKHAG